MSVYLEKNTGPLAFFPNGLPHRWVSKFSALLPPIRLPYSFGFPRPQLSPGPPPAHWPATPPPLPPLLPLLVNKEAHGPGFQPLHRPGFLRPRPEPTRRLASTPRATQSHPTAASRGLALGPRVQARPHPRQLSPRPPRGGTLFTHDTPSNCVAPLPSASTSARRRPKTANRGVQRPRSARPRGFRASPEDAGILECPKAPREAGPESPSPSRGPFNRVPSGPDLSWARATLLSATPQPTRPTHDPSTFLGRYYPLFDPDASHAPPQHCLPQSRRRPALPLTSSAPRPADPGPQRPRLPPTGVRRESSHAGSPSQACSTLPFSSA